MLIMAEPNFLTATAIVNREYGGDCMGKCIATISNIVIRVLTSACCSILAETVKQILTMVVCRHHDHQYHHHSDAAPASHDDGDDVDDGKI